MFQLTDRKGKPQSFDTEFKALTAWCKETAKTEGKVKSKGKSYWNFPCSFDIETTSYYDNGEKRATMYAYVIGINGRVFVGRTWDEFRNRIWTIEDEFGLGKDTYIVVYVHNLSYEFQWIRKRFYWSKVFSLDERKVVYAESDEGLLFKCSYILSNYSLAKVGENLVKYKREKMVGDLDYNLLRGSTTPLTEKEWRYIYHDGLVVMAYIQEEIERNGDITSIPNTSTGYVRNDRKKACLHDSTDKEKDKLQYQYYHGLRTRLKRTPDEYKLARFLFAGGFTHANFRNAGKTFDNVWSMDFTSSYPAVMVMEKFPMTKGNRVKVNNEEELRQLSNKYLRIFTCRFTNLRSKYAGDHYLSLSKCMAKPDNVLVDNGRIISCDSCVTARTNIDYGTMQISYSWDKREIGKCYIYVPDYLPTCFVKELLGFYVAKTSLKGVAGKEVEYLHGKAKLNSCYGRCVTDISRDEILYEDNEWSTDKKDIDKDIEKYNKSKVRFISYLWGVFVTAYARRNLWTAIKELGDDYIYSDTDSVKYLNHEKHQHYFDEYNKTVRKKLERARTKHKLPWEMVEPSTIKGEKKLIGVWDFDGSYKRFKTLGAKRYRVEYPDGKMGITIAGVSKKSGMDYLRWKYKTNDAIFEAFDKELRFPSVYYTDDGERKEGAGKNLHTYIDFPTSGEFMDYLGNKQKWTEKSSVHLEPTSYSLSILQAYIDLRNGVFSKN